MSAAITVAAIGAASGFYGASQNAKAAGKATDQQAALTQADLDFRKQQYERYLGLMGPIEEKLAAEAKSELPLDYEKNASQTKANYAAAQRGITTAMGLRGMAGSGLDDAAIRGAAYGQASDLSKDWSQGLVNKRNLGLTLTGRGQIERAAQGVSSGLQGLGNFYGNQANLYNAAAQQGWANFGQGLKDISYLLGGENAPKEGIQPEEPEEPEEKPRPRGVSTQTNAIWDEEDQEPIVYNRRNTFGLMPGDTFGLQPWRG